MFTETLFTIAEIRKQPKYLLMCKENVVCVCVCVCVHVHRGILFSHKKEWNPAICDDMDGLQVK